MNDLNPPPERDLDRHHRDVIRAAMIDAAPEHGRRIGPPLLAAAAVGAVVAAGIVGTQAGGDQVPAGGGPGAPIGSSTATVAPTTGPTPTLSVPHFPERTGERTLGKTAYTTTPDPNERPPAKPAKEPEAICRELLTAHGERVPGQDARVVASTAGRWGTTMILADGNRWAGCDTAGYRYNNASLREPARIAKPSAGDDDAFAVDEYAQSQTWSGGEPWYQYFWAAGMVPDGVAKIMYTFPGGRTAFAKITGDYWVMQHEGGPIAMGQDNDQPNIKVTLTRPDGSVIRTFPLAWGEQTCAVVNHGC